MTPIGIFGAGWVGLVTGACFAELGHDVVVRDIDPERIATLREGRLPFHEPGLGEVLERNRERLRFTLDASEAAGHAELLFVCVGTPPTHSGDADLSAVWTVVDELPSLERRAVLVMKSTVPVRTGEKVRAMLDARDLAHVGYVSNPEFLAEGSAVHDFMHPDRVVVGAFAEADGDRVAELYRPLDTTVVRADVNSAEMIKLAANAALATRISFINEIANVCEATGADVARVAEGIGLDHRLGPHFLRAGMGWGGSCLAAEETVLVRRGSGVRLIALGALFDEVAANADGDRIETHALEVLAWRPESDGPEFLPLDAVTRRTGGPMLEVRTKMGRRVRVTPDHPFVTSEGTKRADELTTNDWLPIAVGGSAEGRAARFHTLDALAAAGLTRGDVIVRVDRKALAAVGAPVIRTAAGTTVARSHDIVRCGALRLPELDRLGEDVGNPLLGTTTNGTYVPDEIEADEAFWRVVGLYCAEGHRSRDGRRVRLQWSFHPRDEWDLVADVHRFWLALGVEARIRRAPTSSGVVISSRLLGTWWTETLGLGANCYEQRVPDALWTEPVAHKRAFLAGLWLGDGSWSYVNGGPSVVLEYGTVSRELVDGVLRLLGELGIVARLRVGRVAKSTCDTYWLVVSGAGQVERLLELVPERHREPIAASLARQAKRIAPTGYRRGSGCVWARVVEVSESLPSDYVYSLEVPGAHTFVTTGGLVLHNCFPKDSLALKQLASNSGYHFQLLSAVIEVNELQKRRVVGKLEKHLGRLRGKTIALLGLSFKPNTDDMRDAPSLVLASRLLAEGAGVRAWDPMARPAALLHAATICETVLEAVTGADAAVIVTEWDELRGFPGPEVREAMRTPLVIDGRNLLDPDTVRAAGFAYEGIGRAAGTLATLPSLAADPL